MGDDASMSTAGPSPSTAPRPPAIDAWAASITRHDAGLAALQLSDDVVLTSPLTDAFHFEGRDHVAKVFEAALELLDGSEVVAITGTDREWVVRTTATLDGRPLDEAQWLTLGPDGRICAVVLYVRPVPAALGLLSSLGPGLHARGVLPRRAAIASRGATPMTLMLGAVERWIMPRVGPRRRARAQLGR